MDIYYACIINIVPLQWMKAKTIDHILRTVWISVSKMYHEEALKKESTMATGFTLISIDPEYGTSSMALGPKMGMEATSLSRTLKSMESKGLIQRKPNPEDGRGVIIHLTEFGRSMRNFSKEIVIGFDQKVRQAITQEELETFNRVAQTIMDLAQSNQPFIKK